MPEQCHQGHLPGVPEPAPGKARQQPGREYLSGIDPGHYPLRGPETAHDRDRIELARGMALRGQRNRDPGQQYADQRSQPQELFRPVQGSAQLGTRVANALYLLIGCQVLRQVAPELRGPVGIIDTGTQVAQQGFPYLLFFLGLISVNLAVINFLPIPIVDGGHMVFLAWEKITGKPPSEKVQVASLYVGLGLIGFVFIATFYFDVMRIVTGWF